MPRRAEHVTLFKDPSGNPDTALIQRLALIDQDISSGDLSSGCLNYTQLLSMYNARNGDTNQIQYDKQNCAKLGGAKTPYFDAGLVQMRAGGKFYVISTRNNNFSNRAQRGIIVVNGGQFATASNISFNIGFLSTILLAIFFVLM